MREAVIVSSVRTPVGKAPRGSLRTVRPETLAVTAIRAALERAPGLDPAEIDDIVWGCAFPEAEQGLNLAPLRRPAGRAARERARRDREPVLLVRACRPSPSAPRRS